MKKHCYTPIFCFSLVTIILLTASRASAQDVAKAEISLTLAQIWEQASANNKKIRANQLLVQSSAELVKDAKSERLPEIQAEGEYARVSNMPIYNNGFFSAPGHFNVLHNSYAVGGDVYFNIYEGKRTNTKIQEEKKEHEIKEVQQLATIADVKLNAAAFYLDLMRSIVFRKLMLYDIAEEEKQLKEIKTLLQNGVVLKSDVLRDELKLSREKVALLEIENDITIANQKLQLICGLPAGMQIIPGDHTENFITHDDVVDAYITEGTESSYAVRISEKETSLKKLNIKAVKGNLAPKIGLFANYAISYPQIRFYPYEGSAYGLGMYGIKASFAIDGFYHNKHKTTAAVLDYQSQELEHADTEDILHQQITEGYLRYKEALTKIDVARTNVKQASENYRIVKNTYFNQLSLITDLLDADTQVLQTQFDLAAAQIAAQFKYYQLQRVTGKL